MKSLIKGTILSVSEVIEGTSAKGAWSKQTLLIKEKGEKYDNDIAIEIWNDNVGKFKVGQAISADVDVTSREYGGRFYTTVKAWKLGVIESAQPQPSTILTGNGESDILPF
jgi:Domain of unknown function (DUF3127)